MSIESTDPYFPEDCGRCEPASSKFPSMALRAWQDECGWTDDTLLALLLDAIDDRESWSLVDDIAKRAREELNSATAEGGES